MSERAAKELSLIVSGPMSAGKAELARRLAAEVIPAAVVVIATEDHR